MITIEDLRRIALEHARVVELERAGAIVRRESDADRRWIERQVRADREAAPPRRVRA